MKSLNFLPANHSMLHFHGNWMPSTLPQTQYTYGNDNDFVEILGQFRDLYGIFYRHEWSGIARLEVNGTVAKEFDLFSAYPHYQRLLLFNSDKQCKTCIRISATGQKNHLAFGNEIVFRGFDSSSALAPQALDEPGRLIVSQKTREAFAKMQAAHVDRWRVLQEDGCADAISKDRRRLYLQRYIRASAFFGRSLLDVGCGYLFSEILDLLTQRDIEYHGLDIDARVVEAVNKLLRERDIRGKCQWGEIGTADLCLGNYDTIFSSHAIEHSSSLPVALRNVFEALKPSGYFIMAVPIGWDDSEEHTQCYSVDEWTMAVRREKFEVISAEIGKLYDPSRYDVTIIAQKPDI